MPAATVPLMAAVEGQVATDGAGRIKELSQQSEVAWSSMHEEEQSARVCPVALRYLEEELARTADASQGLVERLRSHFTCESGEASPVNHLMTATDEAVQADLHDARVLNSMSHSMRDIETVSGQVVKKFDMCYGKKGQLDLWNPKLFERDLKQLATMNSQLQQDVEQLACTPQPREKVVACLQRVDQELVAPRIESCQQQISAQETMLEAKRELLAKRRHDWKAKQEQLLGKEVGCALQCAQLQEESNNLRNERHDCALVEQEILARAFTSRDELETARNALKAVQARMDANFDRQACVLEREEQNVRERDGIEAEHIQMEEAKHSDDELEKERRQAAENLAKSHDRKSLVQLRDDQDQLNQLLAMHEHKRSHMDSCKDTVSSICLMVEEAMQKITEQTGKGVPETIRDSSVRPAYADEVLNHIMTELPPADPTETNDVSLQMVLKAAAKQLAGAHVNEEKVDASVQQIMLVGFTPEDFCCACGNGLVADFGLEDEFNHKLLKRFQAKVVLPHMHEKGINQNAEEDLESAGKLLEVARTNVSSARARRRACRSEHEQAAKDDAVADAEAELARLKDQVDAHKRDLVAYRDECKNFALAEGVLRRAFKMCIAAFEKICARLVLQGVRKSLDELDSSAVVLMKNLRKTH